jgi:two-component system, NarL family, nitrate/nitrite response regulator NarL
VIRVFVVVGVRLYREGIACLLDRGRGIVLAGMAGRVDEAAAALAAASPDVILLDLSSRKDLGTVHRLRQEGIDAKIVALGMPEHEDEIIAAAEAGIEGYALRDAPLEDLVAAIGAAVRGDLSCSPSVAGMLLRRVRTQIDRPVQVADRRASGLTAREADIVALIGEGLSNKQIAAALHLATSTVKNHVHNMMRKLGVSRRTDVALLARDLLIASGSPTRWPNDPGRARGSVSRGSSGRNGQAIAGAGHALDTSVARSPAVD